MGFPPYMVGIRFIKCSCDWVPFDEHFKPMTSVVFCDDIDSTIPIICMAIKAQSVVKESKPAAKKAKPAAKKAKYALSSTGSNPGLNNITNYFMW